MEAAGAAQREEDDDAGCPVYLDVPRSTRHSKTHKHIKLTFPTFGGKRVRVGCVRAGEVVL